MAEEGLRCLPCQSAAGGKYGTASKGKARFRCQQRGQWGRPCLGVSAYAGRVPEVKRQSVEMPLTGSGVRERARGLQGSPTTVRGELKKG
jgi:transposase-like protein